LLTATGDTSPLTSDAATPSSGTDQSTEIERQSANFSWFSRLVHLLSGGTPKTSFMQALLDPLAGALSPTLFESSINKEKNK